VLSQNAPAFVETVNILRSEHLSAARSTIRDQKLLRDLEAEIERDCDQLKGFLYAAQVCTFHALSTESLQKNVRSLTKSRLVHGIASSVSERSWHVNSWLLSYVIKYVSLHHGTP
jgi:hypothetical protein